MPKAPPQRITLVPDDYAAEFVGWTEDGRQFFLTNPFEPKTNTNAGREYLAIYTFDAQGKLLEARIDDLGERARLDQAAARMLREQRMAELGPVTRKRIDIAPFAVARFGSTFGLIVRPVEDEDNEQEERWVEVMPGNYMAFHEPWDSGEYDT